MKQTGSKHDMIKSAYDWTLEMMNVLQTLDNQNREILAAWEFFASPDGGIGFFVDKHLSEPGKARQSDALRTILIRIKENFRKFEVANDRLGIMRRECREYSENVSQLVSSLSLS